MDIYFAAFLSIVLVVYYMRPGYISIKIRDWFDMTLLK